MINMSQERLAHKLGITFQQVQKYEKGTNRIGASRLQAIATALGVPVTFFFEEILGAPEKGPAQRIDEFTTLLSTSAGLELVKAFNRIRRPAVRKQIVQLAEAIAEDGK